MKRFFAYSEKLDIVKQYLLENKISYDGISIDGYVLIITGNFDGMEMEYIKSIVTICNEDLPSNYRTPELIYSILSSKFTDPSYEGILQATLTQYPFFDIYLRLYDYADAKRMIKNAMWRNLISQYFCDMIISCIP
jgi:hypothetical protein